MELPERGAQAQARAIASRPKVGIHQQVTVPGALTHYGLGIRAVMRYRVGSL